LYNRKKQAVIHAGLAFTALKVQKANGRKMGDVARALEILKDEEGFK